MRINCSFRMTSPGRFVRQTSTCMHLGSIRPLHWTEPSLGRTSHYSKAEITVHGVLLKRRWYTDLPRRHFFLRAAVRNLLQLRARTFPRQNLCRACDIPQGSFFLNRYCSPPGHGFGGGRHAIAVRGPDLVPDHLVPDAGAGGLVTDSCSIPPD